MVEFRLKKPSMAKRGVCGENKMKVSVITVCYNAILGIEKTIKSVVGQTYPEVEYIVIDGGSTDGTIDIIKKYTDKIACFVSEPDGGIYDAMNKGIRIATGEWINFMNAGDTFSSDTIISTVFSERYKEEVEVIYGDVYFTESHDCNYLQPARPLYFLRRAMPFCHQSSFVKRKAITEFDKQFQICADYSFFIRCITISPIASVTNLFPSLYMIIDMGFQWTIHASIGKRIWKSDRSIKMSDG